MPRIVSQPILAAVLILAAASAPFHAGRSAANSADTAAFLGFDRNDYPGDQALPILRQTFAFSSYWLSAPPGENANSWTGKREILRAQGFGFVLLYPGRAASSLKTQAAARKAGALDARNAAASAKAEGFPPRAVIFLDIEDGGRLSPLYHAYLRAWTDELARGHYRPGFYCSGIPVDEGGGVTIVTADDIRNHLPASDAAYWIYNDACPPSPGCLSLQHPAPPSASGVPYAAVWQFSQSPRRKQFTSRCAATYHIDGNCYAPGDTAHAWYLDFNTATSPDPSAGRRQE